MEKDGRTILQDKTILEKINKTYEEKIKIITKVLKKKLYQITGKDKTIDEYKKGKYGPEVDKILEEFDHQFKEAEIEKKRQITVLKNGYDLQDSVLKIIRIFIARKKHIEAGDKLCGRYGNKGVISEVLPICDMPFFADGTPVDLLISPLGIPARMNIGQVLETTVGYALMELRKNLKELYWKIKTNPSDENINKIRDLTNWLMERKNYQNFP